MGRFLRTTLIFIARVCPEAMADKKFFYAGFRETQHYRGWKISSFESWSIMAIECRRPYEVTPVCFFTTKRTPRQLPVKDALRNVDAAQRSGLAHVMVNSDYDLSRVKSASRVDINGICRLVDRSAAPPSASVVARRHPAPTLLSKCATPEKARHIRPIFVD